MEVRSRRDLHSNAMNEVVMETRKKFTSRDSAKKSRELLDNISSLREYTSFLEERRSPESDDELKNMMNSLVASQRMLLNENRMIKKRLASHAIPHTEYQSVNTSLKNPYSNKDLSFSPLEDNNEKINITGKEFNAYSKEDGEGLYLEKMRDRLLKDIEFPHSPIDTKPLYKVLISHYP